jgi:hypothetical protein
MESILEAHSRMKAPGERQMLVANDKAVEQTPRYIWATATSAVTSEAEQAVSIVMLGPIRPKQNEMRLEAIAGELEQPAWASSAAATSQPQWDSQS